MSIIHKLKVYAYALRVHQYTKNGLLWVPMFLATTLNWPIIQRSLIGFIGFSLIASTVYLVNDIVDLDHDRAHPHKKNRPLASGALSLPMALLMSITCLSIGFMMIGFLGQQAILIVLFYFVLSITYTFLIKRILVLDVIVLALLYTIRIIAGGIFSNTQVSDWLLIFSVFFFFGLAMIKRYSELSPHKKSNEDVTRGRSYRHTDIPLISTFGIVSSMCSLVVFAMYIYSEQSNNLYVYPNALWGIWTLLLYWTGKLWFAVYRQELQGDPVTYMLKQKTSYVLGLLVLSILLLSRGLL